MSERVKFTVRNVAGVVVGNITGSCVATATKYKVSAAFQQTTSTTFVDVVETGITFTQGGSSSSCVIVSFSAQATTEPHT